MWPEAHCHVDLREFQAFLTMMWLQHKGGVDGGLVWRLLLMANLKATDLEKTLLMCCIASPRMFGNHVHGVWFPATFVPGLEECKSTVLGGQQMLKVALISLFHCFLTLCEASAKNTNLRKMQFYKSIFYEKKEALLLITTLPCLKLLSHWSRKTSPKVRGALKRLPKIVSKRSHQEECIHSAKTAKCVASCVASQVLQVTDKLPSFPSKAEFSQIER